MKNKKLHNIKSTGYKIPDFYFESLEDAIFSRMKEEQTSIDIVSTGFSVPNGFFETLDAKILKTVEENVNTKVHSLVTWKKVAYISGIAASFIIALNLFFDNSNKLTFDDLETASIESYLINEDLNAYDIAPYLSTNEIKTDDFVENAIDASDIEEYLMQNSDVEHLITD